MDDLMARFSRLPVPSRAGELPPDFQRLSEAKVEDILTRLESAVPRSISGASEQLDVGDGWSRGF